MATGVTVPTAENNRIKALLKVECLVNSDDFDYDHAYTRAPSRPPKAHVVGGCPNQTIDLARLEEGRQLEDEDEDNLIYKTGQSQNTGLQCQKLEQKEQQPQLLLPPRILWKQAKVGWNSSSDTLVDLGPNRYAGRSAAAGTQSHTQIPQRSPMYAVSNSSDSAHSGDSSSSSSRTVNDNNDSSCSKGRPDGQIDDIPVPGKKGTRAYRFMRWNFGSVYRRIFTLAFLGNMVALAVLVAHTALGKVGGGAAITYKTALTAVSSNLFVAIAMRNEHVINALFLCFGSWRKHRLPLRVRHLFAKVYSYGGIHSGCSVAATIWYMAYLVLLTLDYTAGKSAPGQPMSIARGYVLLVSYGIIGFLLTMLVFAHPRMRVVMHNWFEGIHRFLGWTVVLLFWAVLMLLTADAAATEPPLQPGLSWTSPGRRSFGGLLATNPSFWLLLATTMLVIYPWTRLRLRAVEAEPLSEHCIKLNFDYRDAHYGQAIRLSDAPLRETHAFATIPNPAAPAMAVAVAPLPCRCDGCTCSKENARVKGETPAAAAVGLSNAGKKGFSVIISNAGDWTSKMIKNPPSKIYTRGVPQYGVLRVAGMFEPVIVMATGSGIAPCLSLFAEKPDHPVRIIWSTPRPLETFGQSVIDAVFLADPEAVIIDTRKTGRPDLVNIAYRMWAASRKSTDYLAYTVEAAAASGITASPGLVSKKNASGPCEAVVIISNQTVTRKVVYGLESRGVAAYGAIFDS